MTMSEKRVRQIIREEARRVLRENENGFDGPGVGPDAVNAWYDRNGISGKSHNDMHIMLENYSEILEGGDPPGVAQHYPGWNRKDFAELTRLILVDLGVTHAALQVVAKS